MKAALVSSVVGFTLGVASFGIPLYLVYGTYSIL